MTKDNNMMSGLNDIMQSISKLVENFRKQQVEITKTMQPIFETVAKLTENLQPTYRAINQIMSNIPNNFGNISTAIEQVIQSLDLDTIKMASENLNAILKDNNLKTLPNSKEGLSEGLLDLPKEINYTNFTTRKRRHIIRNIVVFLVKNGLETLLTIILFLFAPLYSQNFNPNQYYIRESMQEIEQIKQEEGIEQELRVITKRTYIYKGVKMRKILQQLEVGDIVIVLEANKEKLKIQDYQTGIVGYITKKYSVAA